MNALKDKLTSRKLWMAVAGLIAGLLALFNAPSGYATQVSGVILSFGSVVAYVIGQGMVDAATAASIPQDTAIVVPIGVLTDTAQPATAPDVKTPEAQATAATINPPDDPNAPYDTMHV